MCVSVFLLVCVSVCLWALLPAINLLIDSKEHYTRGVQKVLRPTLLTTRYAHHILSLCDIYSCNWNALGPGFLQTFHSVVEELLFLVFQPASCRADNVLVVRNCVSFHEFFQFRKKTEVTWSQDNTWSHVSSSTGCRPKCRLWTTPSPTVFAIHIRIARQMAGWKTKNNNSSTTGMRASEKCWTRCIIVAVEYVKKTQHTICISPS